MSCDLFDTSLKGEHINTSGWTFQEHMLSPRIPLFTQDGPVWQCNQATIPDYGCGKVRPWLKPPPTSNCEEAVKYYASRDLTHKYDKFLAISALARKQGESLVLEHGEEVHDLYWAALWKPEMIQHLPWRCEKRVAPRRRDSVHLLDGVQIPDSNTVMDISR